MYRYMNCNPPELLQYRLQCLNPRLYPPKMDCLSSP